MSESAKESGRYPRILIARGRDAADAPLTQTFGENTLTNSRTGPMNMPN
jgi:hypothetical protein